MDGVVEKDATGIGESDALVLTTVSWVELADGAYVGVIVRVCVSVSVWLNEEEFERLEPELAVVLGLLGEDGIGEAVPVGACVSDCVEVEVDEPVEERVLLVVGVGASVMLEVEVDVEVVDAVSEGVGTAAKQVFTYS